MWDWFTSNPGQILTFWDTHSQRHKYRIVNTSSLLPTLEEAVRKAIEENDYT